MEKLPLYQTRKFWTVLFIVYFVVCLYLLFNGTSGADLEKVAFSFGGGFFYIFGYMILKKSFPCLGF